MHIAMWYLFILCLLFISFTFIYLSIQCSIPKEAKMDLFHLLLSFAALWDLLMLRSVQLSDVVLPSFLLSAHWYSALQDHHCKPAHVLMSPILSKLYLLNKEEKVIIGIDVLIFMQTFMLVTCLVKRQWSGNFISFFFHVPCHFF